MKAYLNIIYREIKRERVELKETTMMMTGRQRLEDRILFSVPFRYVLNFFHSSSSQCSVMVNLRLSAHRKGRKMREREKKKEIRLSSIRSHICIFIYVHPSRLLFFISDIDTHIHRQSMAMSRRKQPHPRSKKGK